MQVGLYTEGQTLRDRQTYMQTNRQIKIETYMRNDRDSQTIKHRQTDGQRYRLTDVHTDKQTDIRRKVSNLIDRHKHTYI